MKCRQCNNHAAQLKPCHKCRKATCRQCMIEAHCHDCWAGMNAERISREWTEEYRKRLTEYVLCRNGQDAT